MRYRSFSILALCTVVLILTVCASANAAAPMLLNYQGNLTDPLGQPKDGTFSMTFSIWDAESAGSQLPVEMPWQETIPVPVTNGSFSVLLGGVVPLANRLFEDGPSDVVGPLRFLQVSIEGEDLAPRRRLASAPYALSSPELASLTMNIVPVEDVALGDWVAIAQAGSYVWRVSNWLPGDTGEFKSFGYVGAEKRAKFYGSSSMYVDRVRIPLRKVGGGRSVRLSVQGDNGGVPDGIEYAVSIVPGSSVSQGFDEARGGVYFDFPVRTLFTTSSGFWLVLEATGPLDGVNYFEVYSHCCLGVGPVYSGGQWTAGTGHLWATVGFEEVRVAGDIYRTFQYTTAGYSGNTIDVSRDMAIGVALQDIPAGTQGRVQVQGRTSMFSGLSPGSLYLIAGGPGSMSTSGSGPRVGMALTTTDFLVNISR